MEPNLLDYDRIIVAFSGGKDSIACVLRLLEISPYNRKIELWHHDVDGRAAGFMDWPCTPSYCEKFASEYDIPLYFSWLEGGFEREMLRKDDPTAPKHVETPDGIITVGGNSSKLGTRLKFPQVSADLKTRWCSSYLKIGCSDVAFTNQDRFRNSKTLFVSGERAEESPNRARYKTFEPHRKDARDSIKLRRHIDTWRPVHGMTTGEVWSLIEKHRVRPHPAYELGWGRLSCMSCIFGSADQWASVKAIAPERFEKIAKYEEVFEHTIQRTKSIRQLASEGTAYSAITKNPDMVKIAMSESYSLNIYTKSWKTPAGATSALTGPQ